MAFSIRIGAIDYTVEETNTLYSDSGVRCGEHDSVLTCIRINQNISPQAKRVTLMHEIIHGILTNAGQADHDEELVDLLAHGIVGVLRDNPRLFRA